MDIRLRTLFHCIVVIVLLSYQYGKSSGNGIGPGKAYNMSFTHGKYFTSHDYAGTASCLAEGCHDKEGQDELTTYRIFCNMAMNTN